MTDQPEDARSGPGRPRVPGQTNAATSRGGEPTGAEVAAIVAAVEALWPRADRPAAPAGAPRWRFSGRWWTKPVPLRRTRRW